MTEQQLGVHEEEFRRDGYTVLPGLHATRVDAWRSVILADYAHGTNRDDVNSPHASWLNERPDLFLPYVIADDLLDLTERLMGPFVGLTGQGSKISASVSTAAAEQFRVWHRDMWPVPGWTSDYLPPNGITS